jgi:serine/threonine-protein kinase
MKVLRDIVGDTLSDRYRIISRIAGGGMGEIYRGHDLLLDRVVAVKVLQPSLAGDPELVHRFKAEARAAARLSHPNVVQVHDWGSAPDSIYYMVMEFVAGTDLRDVLVGRGPLPPARAVEVVASVCDALQAAHSRGLVHRDVKPENVLIARDGKVKVADFGIAAVADVERSLPGGVILGTLRYLAPEQAAGREATASSDIWAAGALLFELLLGTPPQNGSGAELLRRRAVEPPVAPSTWEPRLPPELDEVVLRALAVDPEARFATAADMALALRALVLEADPDPVPVEDFLVDLTGEIQLPDMEVTRFASRRMLKRSRKPKRSLLKTTLAAVVALLLIAGAVKASGAIFGPHEVDVPHLAGLTYEAATAAADKAGLDIDVTAKKRDPEVPKGAVISQTPAGGQLLEGKPVGVVLSAGLPLVRIPDVTGKSLDAARARLARAHLVVGAIRHEHSIQYPSGTVTSQTLAPNRVEWNTEVALVVSLGARSISVPTIVGKTLTSAERVLRDEGFVPVVSEEYSDTVPKGTVISSLPAAGAEAPETSEVQLVVSKGPEFKELTLPDVRQMDVGSAKSLLESKGLVVKVQQSCDGTTVVETAPVAGSTVRENDTIALFVC